MGNLPLIAEAHQTEAVDVDSGRFRPFRLPGIRVRVSNSGQLGRGLNSQMMRVSDSGHVGPAATGRRRQPPDYVLLIVQAHE